jgi:hypothetical protein
VGQTGGASETNGIWTVAAANRSRRRASCIEMARTRRRDGDSRSEAKTDDWLSEQDRPRSVIQASGAQGKDIPNVCLTRRPRMAECTTLLACSGRVLDRH